MKTFIEVEGLTELQQALRELPDATAKSVLRRVGLKALEPVAARARELVAVDQGDLRDSIAVSTKLSKRQRSKHRKLSPSDVEIFAGPSQGEGASGALPHAHMVEFGTEHSEPQPYMRPAWDGEKDGVLEGIKEDLWGEIEKAAERLARKAAKQGR